MNNPTLHKPSLYYGVKQFTIFIDDQHLSLNEILSLLSVNQLTLIAFSANEASEYLVLRTVTNYPDKLRNILKENNIYFNEQTVLATECIHSDDIPKIIEGIISAEIKINYMYPILSRYNNKIGMILSVEDVNLASKAISRIGFKTISQNDIDR